MYIPLGGNHGGAWRTYRNLLVTMLIGGLWHGANRTFIVWGAYHGVGLALYRGFARSWDTLPSLVRRGATLLFVVLGWVWFRATSMTMALGLFRTLLVPTRGASLPQLPVFSVLLAIAAW